MKKFKRLNLQRERRAFRIANKIKKHSSRPRLCVFRSNKHICAQIVDDALGKTLVSAGTNDKDLRSAVRFGGNCEAAAKVGEVIAQRALEQGIKAVAFDRHGYRYHGRVRQLADAARKIGLDIGAASDGDNAPKKIEKGAAGGKKRKEVAQKGAPQKKGKGK